jgi:hypothetical protein
MINITYYSMKTLTNTHVMFYWSIIQLRHSITEQLTAALGFSHLSRTHLLRSTVAGGTDDETQGSAN